MKIAIIGTGNGGKAAAADLTLAGHNVNLYEFPEFRENMRVVQEKRGVNLVGVGRNGFANLNKITIDIEEALEGAEMILPILPAFGHKKAARVCAPHLIDGQTIVLTPGSTLGSLEFHNVLKETGVKAEIKIAELNTLPYAARGEDAEVRILLEVKKLWIAAFPARKTKGVLQKFKILYPVTEPQKNILEVGLNNGNPVVHPSPSLLNAGRVEYVKGEFYLYVEGITPHVVNVIQAVDDERLVLCRKLGFQEIPSLERLYLTGYSITKSSLYEAYHTSPVFCGEHPIKGPHSLMDRYYVEDTSYGLATWSSLGRSIGVPTPTIDAIVHLISTLHDKNYYLQGERTLERFGLAGLAPQELNSFFETGTIPSHH